MSDLIQWGGEIFDTHGSSSGNTNTSMGSGELSTLGFKKAAYQRNLQYVRTDNKLHDVHDLQVIDQGRHYSSIFHACNTISRRKWVEVRHVIKLHSKLHNINLFNVTPLISPKPSGTYVLSFNLTPCCHVTLPYIMGFDIKINHPRIQTTCLHTSRCHQCKYCRY